MPLLQEFELGLSSATLEHTFQGVIIIIPTLSSLQPAQTNVQEVQSLLLIGHNKYAPLIAFHPAWRRVCLYSQQSHFFIVCCQGQNPLKTTTTTTNLRKLLYSTGLNKVDNHSIPDSLFVCSNSVVCSSICMHIHRHMDPCLCTHGLIVKWLTVELKAT